MTEELAQAIANQADPDILFTVLIYIHNGITRQSNNSIHIFKPVIAEYSYAIIFCTNP